MQDHWFPPVTHSDSHTSCAKQDNIGLFWSNSASGSQSCIPSDVHSLCSAIDINQSSSKSNSLSFCAPSASGSLQQHSQIVRSCLKAPANQNSSPEYSAPTNTGTSSSISKSSRNVSFDLFPHLQYFEVGSPIYPLNAETNKSGLTCRISTKSGKDSINMPHRICTHTKPATRTLFNDSVIRAAALAFSVTCRFLLGIPEFSQACTYEQFLYLHDQCPHDTMPHMSSPVHGTSNDSINSGHYNTHNRNFGNNLPLYPVAPPGNFSLCAGIKTMLTKWPVGQAPHFSDQVYTPPSHNVSDIHANINRVDLIGQGTTICEALASGLQYRLETSVPNVEMHPHAEWILNNLQINSVSLAKQIFIYTDGSLPELTPHSSDTQASNDQAPAWSFTVCGIDEQGNFFRIGHSMQQLIHSGPIVNLVPVTYSTTPELVAILYALIWIASSGSSVRTTIFSDSTVAIGHASQRTAPTASIQVVEYIVTLARRIQEVQGMQVDFTHVYAHTGHPWNEMADSMAKAAATNSHQSQISPSLPKLLDNDHICWSSTALGHSTCTSYPPVSSKQFYYDRSSNKHIATKTGSISDTQNAKKGACKEIHFEFDCATHNVRSIASERGLTPDEQLKSKCSASVAALQVQYLRQNLLVVALQEAGQFERATSIGSYYIIASGNFGVELWFSLVTPFCKEGHLFHPRDFHVVTTSARLLVVDSDNSKFAARFISAHVPSAEHITERIAFFDTLSRFCHTSLPLFLMLDANSRFNIDEYIDDVSSSVKKAANQFASFLDAHQLVANFSVPAFSNKCRDTWVSTKGNLHTIDYVCFKSSMIGSVKDAATLKHIDNGHDADDHWPSYAKFAFSHQSKPHNRSSQMRKISPQELACPSAAKKFRDCLTNIASPSWDVDLNSHHDKISADIDKAIRIAFPKPRSVAKKPHVDQNMLQHIDYSHDIKRQIRRVKKINVPQTLAYVEAQTTKVGWLSYLANINKILRKIIKRFSRLGFTEYVLRITAELDKSSLGHRPAQAWKAIKKLVALSKSSKHTADKCIPLLQDESGKPAENSAAKASIFFEHFSKIELATSMDTASLLRQYNSDSVALSTCPEVEDFMDPYRFKMGIMSGKKGKKGGIDNVNADLAQLVPDEFTRLYHPLHLKMALFADEPLALKGGIACVLQKKNKQHILTAHKFRSIMLRNYVIKHHHAFLRTRLYALVHCSFHAAQSGGIKGRGTDLANATVRWNQHAYKGHNQSCVIFFTDVEAAFYSTIRELLLPQAQSPDSIEDILDKTGVPLIFVEPLE